MSDREKTGTDFGKRVFAGKRKGERRKLSLLANILTVPKIFLRRENFSRGGKGGEGKEKRPLLNIHEWMRGKGEDFPCSRPKKKVPYSREGNGSASSGKE